MSGMFGAMRSDQPCIPASTSAALDAATAAVAALNALVAGLQTNVDGLSGLPARMTAAESSLSGLSGIPGRVTSLESWSATMTGVPAAITALQTGKQNAITPGGAISHPSINLSTSLLITLLTQVATNLNTTNAAVNTLAASHNTLLGRLEAQNILST